MTSPLDLTRLPTTDPLPVYRYRDGLYAADPQRWLSITICKQLEAWVILPVSFIQ